MTNGSMTFQSPQRVCFSVAHFTSHRLHSRRHSVAREPIQAQFRLVRLEEKVFVSSFIFTDDFNTMARLREHSVRKHLHHPTFGKTGHPCYIPLNEEFKNIK
jgi:hypothetical protein